MNQNGYPDCDCHCRIYTPAVQLCQSGGIGGSSYGRTQKRNGEKDTREKSIGSTKERNKMRTENTDTRRYARDKPSDCAYCYFWKANKKCCGQKECYYLLDDAHPETTAAQSTKDILSKKRGSCKNCVYGRQSPCIGYCIKKILQEMREKKPFASNNGQACQG